MVTSIREVSGSLSVVFRPVGSPRFKSLGCRAAWYPWLLPHRALASITIKAGSYRCRSCSSHPSPALFSLKTSPSWLLTVSSVPDSEWQTPAGHSSCSVSIFCLVSFSPRGSLERRLWSLSPIFPLPLFLWSLRLSEVNGWGAGFGLPIGLSLFQLWGCPASAVAVTGVRCSLVGSFRSSGRFTCPCSRLFFFPIMLPGVVLVLWVCLSRAPALRQMLEATLAASALESPLFLVLDFHSSLSVLEGSSDGLAAVFVSSLLDGGSYSLRSC